MGVPSGESCTGDVWRDTHPRVAAELLKPLTQLCCQGARMACPDGAAIDAYNGYNFCPCPGHKTFISGIQIIACEEAFCSVQPKFLRYFQDTVACHALECPSCGRRGV